MGDVHKPLILPAEVNLCHKERHLWDLAASCMFPGPAFLLGKSDWQTAVFHTWVFASVFLKANEVSLSLQGKQLTVFVLSDKNLRVKIRIFKNLISQV